MNTEIYCRRCYEKLVPADQRTCPRCGRKFDPTKPSTFLTRPYPSTQKIIVHLVITTALGAVIAFIIAMFQFQGMIRHMSFNSSH